MSDPVKNPIDFTFNVGTHNSTDDDVNKKQGVEIALTEAAAVDIKQRDIIPLYSIKKRDRIYSGDFFTLYDD